MWISIGCLFVMLILGFLIGFKICGWYFENKDYFLVCSFDKENENGIQIIGLFNDSDYACDIAIEAREQLDLNYKVIQLKLNSVGDYFEDQQNLLEDETQVKNEIEKLISDVENNE
jgi:hypothetical protein